MSEAERAEVRKHLNDLIELHIGLKRRQHALLDVMERLPDPSPFFADLQELTEYADNSMEHIEAGWDLLNGEMYADETRGSDLLH